MLGNWLYRRYLLSVSWHLVFTVTVVAAAAASALQLLLMFRDEQAPSPSVSAELPPDLRRGACAHVP